MEEDGIQTNGGFYVGPTRRSRNSAINMAGSIHEDSTAQKLGFRGGTVAGSIHMELFPPLFIKAWGRRWFERGSLSLYFVDPTLDLEEVKAVIAVPKGGADEQLQACIQRPDGRMVGEGTASVGDPAEPSALHAREISRFAPTDIRILKGVHPGRRLPEAEVVMPQSENDRRLSEITEPLDWYKGQSPWGKSILTPALYVWMMSRPWHALQTQIKMDPKVVALYGAIEIHNVNGPLLVDMPYRLGGKVVYVGESPKTEYAWYDSHVDDQGGKRVAEMRMMYRFMKASSSLYQETTA